MPRTMISAHRIPNAAHAAKNAQIAALIFPMWLLFSLSLQAATVTGQWDFQSGDLSATTGQALEYMDGPSGSTAAGTAFGAASSFGLPPIGGVDRAVMRIPARTNTMGYKMYPGIAANGGGIYVNQYTMVMDLYFPAKILEEYKALYNAATLNSNAADMYVYGGALGIPGQFAGVINSDTWHRIAWTVNGTIMKKYVDGALADTQTLDAVDGRWSLYTAADNKPTLLFTSVGGDPTVFYVSHVEIRDGVMTDAEILALGGPNGSLGFITLPFLQNVKTDGITIMFERNKNTAATLEYGETASYGSSVACSVATSANGTYIHKAVLTGLTPGRTYHYRAVVSGMAGADGTFRTAPAVEEDFRFGYWADSQGAVSNGVNPYEPVISIFKHMVSRGVAFAVGGGDFSENGSSVYDTRRYCLDRLHKYIGQSVPWFAAWGNHDSYDSGGNIITSVNFIRQFADMPSKDRAGFTAGTGSFSFNYSGCHFICLDAPYVLNPGTPAQYDITNGWLLNDLQSAESQSARFRFLFIHYPPYCELWYSGEANLRADLVPLMEQYNVSACFSGHVHEHECGEQNGVHYIISGGASWLDTGESLVYNWPLITVGGYNTMSGATIGGCLHNYLEIAVSGNQCTVDMHAFNPDGSYRGIADTVTFASPRTAVEDWPLYN